MKLLPKLTHPCPQDWHSMTGDDKSRYCSQCQLHVHNLSAMSAAEQESVFALPGRKCVAMVKGEGSIAVHHGTWLLMQRILRPLRAAAAVVAMMIPCGLSSCATSRPVPSTNASNPCVTEEAPIKFDGKMVAGGIMPPPSWWERLTHLFRR
jgi:hypothetical protein